MSRRRGRNPEQARLFELIESVDSLLMDRGRETRIAVNIPGRYSLADARDARGERRVFGCRAVNLSMQAIAIAGPVKGKPGARVIVDLAQLGRFDGFIARVFQRGFVMTIRATDEERELMRARIEWLVRHKDDHVPDMRADQRFTPSSPYARLILPDGTVLTSVVMDLSVSGAALSAEIVPEIGTVVGVGQIIGRVVRHSRSGFSVKFINVQNRRSVEEMATYE